MVKDPEFSDPLEILCDSAWFGRDSKRTDKIDLQPTGWDVAGPKRARNKRTEIEGISAAAHATRCSMIDPKTVNNSLTRPQNMCKIYTYPGFYVNFCNRYVLYYR